MEKYPSLAEGTGLENREAGEPARGFESLFLRHYIILDYIAGWSSLAARWAHNPKVAGSNPAPATILIIRLVFKSFFIFLSYTLMVICMIVYSHRGESKYAPENTMSAFYLAYFVNSDGIETDLRKTKDNKLVLIHDKTVDRTSNYSGKVSNYTYKELLSINFGNKQYKGEKIVKLEDFLKYFSYKDIELYIEIKEEGYEELIVDTINKYNIENLTLISFKYNILKKIRKLSDGINLGWLIYDLNNKNLEECKAIKLNHVLCTALCLEKDEVKLLKENNFIVCAWGILGKHEIKKLNEIGVDRIIFDSGYDAKKYLKEVKK